MECSMSDLVLSNLTINGRPIGVFDVQPDPPVDPYNPLGLPPYTIRVKLVEGTNPDFNGSTVQISQSPNVWDCTKTSSEWDWNNLFEYKSQLLEVLGANTTGVVMMDNTFKDCSNLTNVCLFDTTSVTEMSGMFQGCYSLTTVPLYDMSNVTYSQFMFESCSNLTTVPLFNTSKVIVMWAMFRECHNLTNIPLFDTSVVDDMDDMFKNCYRVQSGALALYQQASTQSRPPANHGSTFLNCGVYTQTGEAEWVQIPSDWK